MIHAPKKSNNLWVGLLVSQYDTERTYSPLLCFILKYWIIFPNAVGQRVIDCCPLW